MTGTDSNHRKHNPKVLFLFIIHFLEDTENYLQPFLDLRWIFKPISAKVLSCWIQLNVKIVIRCNSSWTYDRFNLLQLNTGLWVQPHITGVTIWIFCFILFFAAERTQPVICYLSWIYIEFFWASGALQALRCRFCANVHSAIICLLFIYILYPKCSILWL